jgi:hypothetical protein
MSRFEFRVARLEKSFPRPDAASFVAGLTEAELAAVVVAGYKEMLADAKTAGDKALAADLAVIVKHDAAKLRGMPDAPHWRRVRSLIEQANQAKPTAGEFSGFQVDGKRLSMREYLRQMAGDIRFNEQFGDVLGRLEAGETVEYVGEDELLLAAARTRPGKPGRTWCEVELVSSVIPGRREYIDMRHREDNTPWTPWRRYCEAAEAERTRLATLAANPAEVAKATKGGRR